MNKIIIREERKEDYRESELVTMRAFWNLHGPGCNEHLLLHKLRNSKDYLPQISRVAELNGRIVGVIIYSKSWICDGDKQHEIVTFGPLAVEPTAQSLGVGGLLLKETLKLAKEAGYPGVCIYGEPKYYPKHGFVTCDKYGITDGEGNNYDALMGFELQENGFAGIKGKLKESEIFEQCDDEEEIAVFTKQFPFYKPLSLKCQWLHEEKLGRICNVQRENYTIQFWEQQIPAKLKGKFYKDGQKFPIVGDYVTFEYNPKGDSRILELCERKSVLTRPFPRDHATRKVHEQEMVANVDYVFIVTSLNMDFSANRVLRYATMTKQSGAIPVAILTKADLCENTDKYVQEIMELLPDIQVHVISSVTGRGLDELAVYMKQGTTIAFMGSSGVGKSTLMNVLVGNNVMETKTIREYDSKGRHTTTYRQMYTLETGVTIIDTPGMRELGITNEKESVENTFDDIVELACQCKFRNCRHLSEPGCAVKKAVEEGQISEKRFKQYLRLRNE